MCKFHSQRKTEEMPPPGPKGWPIVGSALDINVANMGNYLSNLAITYGHIFQLNMFNVTVVCLNSADVIRKAFGDKPYGSIMSNRNLYFCSERFFNGNECITFAREGRGALHKGLKRGVVQAFHLYGDGIKEFEGSVHKEMDRLMASIEKLDSKGFEFEATIKRSLSNIISVLLCGQEIEDELEHIFWDYDKCMDFFVNPVANIIMLTYPFLVNVPGRFRTNYLQLALAKEKIKVKFVDNQIETFKPGHIRGIVDTLIAQKLADEKAAQEVTFTYERIVGTTLEIIGAGILTTLSSLCNMMLCLLHHPEYQQKIQRELDAVVGRNRGPNLSDRENCPFTESVIMESIRYITPVPIFLPHECAEDILFEGYTLRKNCLILGNVDFVHHDENIWGDPWTFRPERFLDDQGRLLPRSHVFMRSWLPFGIGRRQCVGESLARSRLFLYVTTLFQRWSFEPADENLGSCDVRQKEHFQINVTVRPKPFLCRAVRRLE